MTSQTQTQPMVENQRKDVYKTVTDTIIKQLEAGVIPWQQPWSDKQNASLNLPINAVTGNGYRGVNIVLLWGSAIDKKYTCSEWASLKQWGSKGEYIRKGEKGNLIVYTDTFEKEVEGEIRKIPFLKYSIVFNRCQLASFSSNDSKSEVRASLVQRIASVEDYVANTFANISHHAGGANYTPATDKIMMPYENTFVDSDNCTATENYYSVLLHELTHWTGHHSRLDRKIKNKFGDHEYAHEELVAELGAAFLMAQHDISTPKLTNHAAYIANWLKVLKDNKQFIISAASEASKAVDLIKDLQPLKL